MINHLRVASLLLLACTSVASLAAPQLVILVRHAEKANEPREDPALSEAGGARAKALAQALADAGVGAVLTSPLRRTRETAAPLAAAAGLKPLVIGFEGGTAAHVQAAAAAVRQQNADTVLVIGHSNTVPAIIAALGGPKFGDLCETSFGQLFTLLLPAEGGAARLVRSHYGAAEIGPGCH